MSVGCGFPFRHARDDYAVNLINVSTSGLIEISVFIRWKVRTFIAIRQKLKQKFLNKLGNFLRLPSSRSA